MNLFDRICAVPAMILRAILLVLGIILVGDLTGCFCVMSRS